jgi:TonB family protein
LVREREPEPTESGGEGLESEKETLESEQETLERKSRIMTMPFPKKRWLKAVFLTALGGSLMAVAFRAPSPSERMEEAADRPVIELPPEVAVPPLPHTAPTMVLSPAPVQIPEVEVLATRQVRDIARAPTFTPYTVRPDIKNRSEVTRALEREFPPLLKDAGIGGTVQVWFFIDAAGEVQRLMVRESSGHKALDDAALRVAGSFSFTPALNREEAVPVWIALPITFATEDRPVAAGQAKETPWSAFKHFLAVTFEYLGTWIEGLLKRDVVTEKADKAEPVVEPAPVVLPPEPTPSKPDISAAPTFTPYTVRPDIRNRNEVARALERAYPPLLRDAGIGGTAQVWFFIDETGMVRKTQLNESTGHQALDEAALEVARIIDFTAARNRDKPVPVWISLPITFAVR